MAEEIQAGSCGEACRRFVAEAMRHRCAVRADFGKSTRKCEAKLRRLSE